MNTLLLNAQFEYSVQNAKKVQDANLRRYKQSVSKQFFEGYSTNRDRHRNASSPAKLPICWNLEKRASLQLNSSQFSPRRAAPPVPCCARNLTNIEDFDRSSRDFENSQNFENSKNFENSENFEDSQNFDNSQHFEKSQNFENSSNSDQSENLEMSENEGSGRHVSYHRAPPKPPRRVSSQKRHQSSKPVVKKRELGSSHTSSYHNSNDKSINYQGNRLDCQIDRAKLQTITIPKHNNSSSLDDSTNIHFEDEHMLSTFRDSNLKQGSRFDDSKSSLNSSSFMNDSGPIGGKKPLSSSTKSAAMAMCDTLAEFSKLDTIAIACENLILEFDDLLDS